MAKKKRTLSPEHLAKLQAGRARKAKQRQVETTTLPAQSKYDADDIAELRRQVEELKAMQFTQQPVVQNPQFNAQGGIVGTFEKYIIDPARYPDPRERLSQESRLATFAFPLNWELNWDVSVSEYPTIDGRRVKEPKFTIELIQIWRDEDGNPTDKRVKWKRMVMHEDPEAALAIAREKNLEVDKSNEKAFLDEMRYLRVRDWLFEAFYPPKSTASTGRKEEVIGNTLVEVYTVNSESSETMPFNSLKKAKF